MNYVLTADEINSGLYDVPYQVCLFAHVSRGPEVSFGAKVLPSFSSCKSQFWLPLHAFKLSSADGLHPFPVRFGWIHAVCVVAMRNEMQVYSQWTLENLTVCELNNLSLFSENF